MVKSRAAHADSPRVSRANHFTFSMSGSFHVFDAVSIVTIHPSLIARTSAARPSTGITGNSPLFLGTRDSKHLIILCSCFHSVFIGPIVLKRNKIHVLLQNIPACSSQVFLRGALFRCGSDSSCRRRPGISSLAISDKSSTRPNTRSI